MSHTEDNLLVKSLDHVRECTMLLRRDTLSPTQPLALETMGKEVIEVIAIRSCEEYVTKLQLSISSSYPGLESMGVEDWRISFGDHEGHG